jgi:hypothetical protein
MDREVACGANMTRKMPRTNAETADTCAAISWANARKTARTPILMPEE